MAVCGLSRMLLTFCRVYILQIHYSSIFGLYVLHLSCLDFTKFIWYVIVLYVCADFSSMRVSSSF